VWSGFKMSTGVPISVVVRDLSVAIALVKRIHAFGGIAHELSGELRLLPPFTKDSGERNIARDPLISDRAQ
jgi:hypothetical protein